MQNNQDNENHSITNSSKSESVKLEEESPKFGMTSVRGRKRDMEDAISIHASFTTKNTSFFGVFDGHGCSHVRAKYVPQFLQTFLMLFMVLILFLCFRWQ